MPVKILVAEDSVTMRKVMQMTFAGEDAEVVTVDNAQAALQKAQDMRPDVVFVDVGIAGGDGYALTQAIKGHAATGSAAVIMLASQHNPFDSDLGRSAGVDEHVDKPFDSQVVLDKVSQVLSRPRAAAVPAHPYREAGATRPAAPGEAPMPPPPPPEPPMAAAPRTPPGGPTQAPAKTPVKSTVAFDSPRAAPAPPARAAAPRVADAAAARAGNGSAMAQKLSEMGLTPDQVAGVLSLSREVIEQVVWEVVPELAETIIREEIRRLTAE